MKNKKANMFWVITTAVIALIMLYIIVGPIINGILVKKQIVHAGGETERITQDCDGDGAIGLFDDCPCNDGVQKLSKEEKTCPEGISPESAKTNCPALCRK